MGRVPGAPTLRARLLPVGVRAVVGVLRPAAQRREVAHLDMTPVRVALRRVVRAALPETRVPLEARTTAV